MLVSREAEVVISACSGSNFTLELTIFTAEGFMDRVIYFYFGDLDEGLVSFAIERRLDNYSP